MSACEPITLVEILSVRGDFESFAELARVAIARLEREGVRSLRSVNFFTRPEANEIGAVLEFADGRELVAHVNQISGWDEFKRLADRIKLKEMRVHGRIPAEAEAWMRQFGDDITHYGSFVAGFHR